MPHTWIVWDTCQERHSHITIQEMSAVRCPFAFENYHIFYSGRRKHFSYVKPNYSLSDTNLKRIF